jgi:hypothetical protein
VCELFPSNIKYKNCKTYVSHSPYNRELYVLVSVTVLSLKKIFWLYTLSVGEVVNLNHVTEMSNVSPSG